MTRLPRVPALLLAAAWLAACASGGGYRPRAEVALLDIRPLAAEKAAPRYGLTLAVRNPGEAELVLGGLSWRLAIDGRDFAWGVSRQAVSVPAQSEAVFAVEVAGGDATVLRPGPGPYRLHYELAGELDLAGSAARLPFGTSGTLDWQSAAADEGG